MYKILVTGGAGYIGSHCVKLLIERGFDCVVYDNLIRGHAELVKWSPLTVGDICDKEKLTRLLSQHKFDAVMHFAALAYVGESVQQPFEYWDNNFCGTKVLLECSLKAGINKIVFSSTCAVYGQPDHLPIDEDTPTLPINPYGHSKLACEHLMDQLEVACGLKSIRFRYFNAAGSDYASGLGEWHEPETHLLPLVIASAIKKTDPIMVYGDNFPTQDGFAVRDFIHVKDLAIAHVLGLELLLSGGDSQVINLGTGSGTSVLEIIQGVEKVLGERVRYLVADRRAGDPAALVANPKKAKLLLNWKAEHGLDRIIYDAVQWHKMNIEKI